MVFCQTTQSFADICSVRVSRRAAGGQAGRQADDPATGRPAAHKGTIYGEHFSNVVHVRVSC